MASKSLEALLSSTVESLDDSVELMSRAEIWHTHLRYHGAARFTKRHYSQLVELAFLRTFLTWEGFLEEAFILYLLGHATKKGYQPKKYVAPADRQHAGELLLADSIHVDWTAPDRVIRRAKRFFKAGDPFVAGINPRIQELNNMKTIRNVIVHASSSAGEKFKTLVRNELTYYPQRMTPGEFLGTVKAGINPPSTYFTYYTNHFRNMVELIIPATRRGRK
ncbi:MAG: hypothetical protein ACYC9L_03715 [Sulfuricaulis sp.]